MTGVSGSAPNLSKLKALKSASTIDVGILVGVRALALGYLLSRDPADPGNVL